ncbi:hypothetical protein EPN96_06605 [bacterium]|nr:MAG: hypothetical protein EPN96_06605 [bacterium]
MAVEIKFISATAPGGGDGSSGTPWTLAEGVAKAKANRLLKIRPGTYAPASTLALAVDTTAPSSSSPCVFAAVDGSDNAVANPADMIRLDFSGLSSGVGLSYGALAYTFFHGLKFDNAPSHGFSCTSGAYNYSAVTMCSASGNGGAGFNLANAIILIDCKATDNAGGGIVRGNWVYTEGCYTSGNTGAAGLSGNGGTFGNCIFLDGASAAAGMPLIAVNSLIGPYNNAGVANTGAAGAYASIFANMATGLSADGVIDLHNDFFNVTNPVGTDTFLSAGRLTSDPAIQNTIEARAANLRDIAFPLTGIKARIGAWQGQEFKSSGVFGGLR